LLAHPNFARMDKTQEDLYEIQYFYNLYVQENRAQEFRKMLLGLAQMAVWPHPPIEEILKFKASELGKIMPVRSQQGFLNYLSYYDGPDAAELKMALAGWAAAPVQGMHIVTPIQINTQLVRPIARDTLLPKNWHTFVDEGAITRVRIRLGLDRLERAEKN
jgi:hypothetical protein